MIEFLRCNFDILIIAGLLIVAGLGLLDTFNGGNK